MPFCVSVNDNANAKPKYCFRRKHELFSLYKNLTNNWPQRPKNHSTSFQMYSNNCQSVQYTRTITLLKYWNEWNLENICWDNVGGFGGSALK